MRSITFRSYEAINPKVSSTLNFPKITPIIAETLIAAIEIIRSLIGIK